MNQYAIDIHSPIQIIDRREQLFLRGFNRKEAVARNEAYLAGLMILSPT